MCGDSWHVYILILHFPQYEFDLYAIMLTFSISFFQAADIWAMGITLYAFVYGKLPFHDDNIVVLYDNIRNSPLSFPPVPFVSDDLKDLISLMLEKNPAQRITLPDIKVC